MYNQQHLGHEHKLTVRLQPQQSPNAAQAQHWHLATTVRPAELVTSIQIDHNADHYRQVSTLQSPCCRRPHCFSTCAPALGPCCYHNCNNQCIQPICCVSDTTARSMASTRARVLHFSCYCCRCCATASAGVQMQVWPCCSASSGCSCSAMQQVLKQQQRG